MTPKRSIFEDVGATSAGRGAAPAQVAGRTPAAGGGVIDAGRAGARGFVRGWLMVLFVLVTAMIVVGGLTRLTDSGLSITEWRPVTGAVPPLTGADWQAAFDLYRQTPEYLLQNKGMSLESFKVIFWWEWGHRLLGRVVGLVWALGFAGLLIARRMPQGWTGRLALLGLLGAGQGALGWWMVASGLGGTMTDVASYRLALHLGLAFAILGLIAWYVLRIGRAEAALLRDARQGDARLHRMATGLMHLAFVQILLGALVAGLDAGRGYTDWPLMAGAFLPSESLAMRPVWINLFENPAMAQFVHRMAGYLLAVFGIVVALRGNRAPHAATRESGRLMALMLAVQIGLGIVTVLNAAPLALGLAHQVGAVVLFTLIVRLRFVARYPIITSIRGTR